MILQIMKINNFIIRAFCNVCRCNFLILSMRYQKLALLTNVLFSSYFERSLLIYLRNHRDILNCNKTPPIKYYQFTLVEILMLARPLFFPIKFTILNQQIKQPIKLIKFIVWPT